MNEIRRNGVLVLEINPSTQTIYISEREELPLAVAEVCRIKGIPLEKAEWGTFPFRFDHSFSENEWRLQGLGGPAVGLGLWVQEKK